MSVGGFDVELNGVKYMLAEDAEGDHYLDQGDPLRPPNAVTVQGEGARQKFQMRPDTIKWTLTDWSGGEGQIKFDPQRANAWRELTGVRVFERPGTLQPGYYVEDTQDTTGAADLAVSVTPVRGIGNLYGLDKNAANVYEWDANNNKWGAATALSGVTNGANEAAAGDNDAIYWIEGSTDNVWKWTGSGAPTQILNGTITASSATRLVSMGPYLYVFLGSAAKVWEVQKSGGGATLIDDFTEGGQTEDGGVDITVMDGKVYVLVSHEHQSMVREITPTTAAGTGFGYEIARLPGFRASSLWSHAGKLFLSGREGDSEHDTVLYLMPDGNYGSLGYFRLGDDIGSHFFGLYLSGRMLDHFVVCGQVNGSNAGTPFYQIDSVSGGYAILGYDEDGDSTADNPAYPVAYGGDVFVSTVGAATTKRVLRARQDQYTKSSEAISAWHDFDLADEKLLSSLVLSTEDLPADWQIRVDYAIDGKDTWTNVIDYTTTNGNGTKVAVSTDTTTVKFRTLSIRIRLDYTGAGVPTSGPVVLGVDANAMVAKKVQAFRLLLDLSSDKDRQGGFSGEKKIENIRTAGDTEAVISFKDGYESATPGKYTEYDMIIDRYNILLSQPGEGFALVELLEPV